MLKLGCNFVDLFCENGSLFSSGLRIEEEACFYFSVDELRLKDNLDITLSDWQLILDRTLNLFSSILSPVIRMCVQEGDELCF